MGVGATIKDSFEWDVQAFWKNHAAPKPTEPGRIPHKHFERQKPVNKPVVLVTLERLDAVWMFVALSPTLTCFCTVTHFAKQSTIHHQNKF